jgi:hypothetical protein
VTDGTMQETKRKIAANEVKEVEIVAETANVPSEAFSKYRKARKMLLKEMGVSSSNRDPLSELSEIIASVKLNAKRVNNRVNKDYDLIGPDGERIEVKYVANPVENGRIVWKNWHEVKFDREERDKYALVVYLDLNPTANPRNLQKTWKETQTSRMDASIYNLRLQQVARRS